MSSSGRVPATLDRAGIPAEAPADVGVAIQRAADTVVRVRQRVARALVAETALQAEHARLADGRARPGPQPRKVVQGEMSRLQRYRLALEGVIRRQAGTVVWQMLEQGVPTPVAPDVLAAIRHAALVEGAGPRSVLHPDRPGDPDRPATAPAPSRVEPPRARHLYAGLNAALRAVVGPGMTEGYYRAAVSAVQLAVHTTHPGPDPTTQARRDLGVAISAARAARRGAAGPAPAGGLEAAAPLVYAPAASPTMAQRRAMAEGRLTRERACTRKRGYPSDTAHRLATRASADTGETVEAYPCLFCPHWHIGHARSARTRAHDPVPRLPVPASPAAPGSPRR